MTFRKAAMLSTILGLLPFIYGLVHIKIPLFAFWHPDFLNSYAAIILTFVGAIPWGYCLAHQEHCGATGLVLYSSIIAFTGWAFISLNVELLYYAGVFSLMLLLDYLWLKKLSPLDWYLKLRIWVSMIVIFCLCMAWYLTPKITIIPVY